MDNFPLNLCVFDTSKGHFGRTDIYKTCISNLQDKIPLYLFEKLFCHIKTDEGEELVLEEMALWYLNRGFNIKVSKGKFQHFQSSHQSEYCRDMITAFDIVSNFAPYTLWLESDWCWDDKGGKLIDRFVEAIEYLEKNKNILTVRFPRFLNEVERLKQLKEKHGLDVEVEKNGGFYNHNDNFSCNPNICRTRDLYLASLILKRNFEQFSRHSEMGVTNCLKWMSDNKLHYSIFDPNIVSILHYGCETGKEDVAGQVFEKINQL